MIDAIQYHDSGLEYEVASEIVRGLEIQDGFLAGRVIPDKNQAGKFAAQAFFAVDDAPGSPLPDNMRWVKIPDGMLAAMGCEVCESDSIENPTVIMGARGRNTVGLKQKGPFEFDIVYRDEDLNETVLEHVSGSVQTAMEAATRHARQRHVRMNPVNPDLGPYPTKQAAERAFKASSLRFGKAKASFERLSDGWYFSPKAVNGRRGPGLGYYPIGEIWDGKKWVPSRTFKIGSSDGDMDQREWMSNQPPVKRIRYVHGSSQAFWKAIERRSNPESEAAAVYEEFHGVPSTEIIEVEEEIHDHAHLASLGEMRSIKVLTPARKKREIRFPADGPVTWLASSEDRTQLYLEGGDQSLDLSELGFTSADERDLMLIGEIHEITYFTRKKMHGMDPVEYYHAAGEETGVRPVLLYDLRSQKLSIAGGQYEVKPEGIVN